MSGLPLDIDLLVTESLDFEKLLRDGVTITAWEIPIPVASIDGPIAMKRQAGRPQDLLDIEHLLHLKE